MKLSKFREKADKYTSKTSEITRQLSLAGVAIIWLFYHQNLQSPALDKFLLIPLIFLVLALLFDLLQYFVGGKTWMDFYRKKEKELRSLENDPEILAPSRLNKPIYFFYYGKIVLMVFSYFFIIGYLLDILL